MHPSNHIRESKGTDLRGKKIVVAVTGSIAAVECVKLVRELIREGAEVCCVMTDAARTIIHPYALDFASGNPTITEITGMVEHVSLCGDVPDKADLFLVSPATANTISKIAMGIDDTPVTTFATTAMGSGVSIMIVPAMHKSMYQHPVVIDNIERLKSLGITFVGPNLHEGTAKIASMAQIVDEVVRTLDRRLADRKVIVVTGRTQEPIDTMRVITNRATGKSGIELARRAYRRGADVELWCGNVTSEIPRWIPCRHFDTLEELMNSADDVQGTLIVPAALSDFAVKEANESKIPSTRSLELALEPLPKFIEFVKDRTELLVAYKAADTRDEVVEKAEEMVVEARADVVIANSLKDVREGVNRIYITRDGKWYEGRKRDIADRVLDNIERP